MGIKTKLTKRILSDIIDVQKLTKTKNGVSDTVYILNDKYILKLFETASVENIKNEIYILDLVKNIKVPKIKKDIFFIKNKPILLYKKCKGNSLIKVKTKHIKQIGKFLNKFHTLTKNKSISNNKLFTKLNLKKLIKKTNNKEFKTLFKTINIKLKNDGIIHGDLFVDNAIFKNDKLSCIIDFGDSCDGDFLLDLAIASISWCKTKKDLEIILNSYGSTMKLANFQKYINYALLYYSVTRYLDNRDYQELLKKIKL